MPEKGLISFIKSKLENGISQKETKSMLTRAGFEEKKIDDAFEYIKRTDKDSHRDEVAEHDFMPKLRDKDTVKKEVEEAEQLRLSSMNHRGLFKGRLRRKDFILGFLFFFGIGYVALVFTALFVSIWFPQLWSAMLTTIERDTNGMLVIALPVILLPITIMMISLITRRLHNLGLSGGLSFLFLLIFAPAIGQMFYGIFAIDIALLILFILLLTKKGDSAPNAYGPFPESRGSFFKRIFNQ